MREIRYVNKKCPQCKSMQEFQWDNGDTCQLCPNCHMLLLVSKDKIFMGKKFKNRLPKDMT